METVRNHFEQVVRDYTVPEPLKMRFKWLSEGDVSVQEKLLNHFMHMDRLMMAQALNQKAGIFLNQIRINGAVTQKLSQEIVVGNHKVVLNFSAKGNGVAKGTMPADEDWDALRWLFWIIVAISVCYYFFS